MLSLRFSSLFVDKDNIKVVSAKTDCKAQSLSDKGFVAPWERDPGKLVDARDAIYNAMKMDGLKASPSTMTVKVVNVGDKIASELDTSVPNKIRVPAMLVEEYFTLLEIALKPAIKMLTFAAFPKASPGCHC